MKSRRSAPCGAAGHPSALLPMGSTRNQRRPLITDFGAYERPADIAGNGPRSNATRNLSRADAQPQQHGPSDGQRLPHSKRVHIRDVAVAAC